MAMIGVRAFPRIFSQSMKYLKTPDIRSLSSTVGVLGSFSRPVTRWNVLANGPSVLIPTRLAHMQGNDIFSQTKQPKPQGSFKAGGGGNRTQSPVRHNFHEDCERLLNDQLNLEFYASYTYRSMAWYFDRADVALKGFHDYCKRMANEELEHAELILGYLNKRGGNILLCDIKKPDCDEWGDGLNAMEVALDLEKRLNVNLLNIHEVAGTHHDAHLSDFLEEFFLREQVEAIKVLSDYITILRRVGCGLGEHIFDQETLQELNDK